MNRYLVKIAEITSLPYRPRAEIVIVHPKAGKVLVTKNSRDGRTWKGLPGGGIEPGDNVVDIAVKEALEEVGVAVTGAKERGCALYSTDTLLQKRVGIRSMEV